MTIFGAEVSWINGAQGSGPTSDEGKSRSSQNALKQRLFSKRRFIGDENPVEFESLLNSIATTYQPATATEWILIDRMVMARWRLGRLERAEAAQIQMERNRYLFASESDKWERYGGRNLTIRLPQISEEKLKAAAADRDGLIERSLSAPVDFDKYVRLSAALNREFDTALRQLEEEQERRIKTLDVQPLRQADPSSAGETAKAHHESGFEYSEGASTPKSERNPPI